MMQKPIQALTMMIVKSRVFATIALSVFVLTFGTTGFVLIEKYSIVDGLYMSMITISTVGFGEVAPLSPEGRLFTTALILFGFLTLAFAGHTIGQSLLERVWTGQTERKKMQKKIDALKNHYIVCGYGRVGAAAVAQFEQLSTQFVIIEASEAQIALLKEKGFCYLYGDATNDDVLEMAGIKRARGLLSLLNEDPDNLFVVLSAREMNPTLNIISRSNETSSGPKIIRAGADDVFSPFDSAGKQIASEILDSTESMANPELIECAGDYSPSWIEVAPGSSMEGRTIGELTVDMQRTVLGLRRDAVDHLMPDAEIQLETGDHILVMDDSADSCELLPVRDAPRKVVIVDDNPVIVKLYTRLFQKAGFIPISAVDGHDGLATILKEKPQAAVIDYQLPRMSGIELCREIRRQMDTDNIKLVLFTADDTAKTRGKAMTSGADAVVVKSPEATEVIQTLKGLF